MTCPSPNGICSFFCLGDCDPDTAHELHKERIEAEDGTLITELGLRMPVGIQGTVDIRLNGTQLATIDPNTNQITGLPSQLDFAQFEFINRIYNAITPKP